MKKWIALLLAAVMLFTIAGCGNKQESLAEEVTEAEEVLIDATRWTYLENTQSERSQTQKVTCCMLPLM